MSTICLIFLSLIFICLKKIKRDKSICCSVADGHDGYSISMNSKQKIDHKTAWLNKIIWNKITLKPECEFSLNFPDRKATLINYSIR